MKFKACLLIICFAASGLTAFAQTDSSAFLRHAISSLEKRPAVEKVYLHLDKTVYQFDDTIWYKAYTIIGPHHQLSALSGVLYLELIGQEDTVITRQLLHLTSGIAWGGIPLSPGLKQGVYRVRAYTRFMQNAGPDYFYDQSIRIGGLAISANAFSSNSSATASATATNSSPDVQFFPEGGELVNGIRSRVAFKALNANGMGLNIQGIIEDNEGNVVTDFAVQHLGMGVFAFTPQSGKRYVAKITVAGGSAFTIALPLAKDKGFALAVNNSWADSIFVKVTASDPLFGEKQNTPFYVIAQSGGKVYYTAKSILVGKVFTASIAKSRFPPGIAQFTLFDRDGLPVAERIAFIQNADTISMHITTSAKSYAAGQRVKILIDTRDSTGKAVPGSFSAAVINESLTGTDEEAEGTILSSLLLTSDLKGYIEKPNYYFTHVTDQAKENLDILMLTQGYRRFAWKNILADTTVNLSYLPQGSLEVAGTLQTPSGKAVAGGSVTLMYANDNLLKDTTTDNSGSFRFTDLYLPDTAILVVRARKENKGSNVTIRIEQPAYPAITLMPHADADIGNMPSQTLATLQKAYAKYRQLMLDDSLKNGIRLKQANIHDYTPKKPDLSMSYNLNGGGNADQVIMGDVLDDCLMLSDCLDGRLTGVRFVGRPGDPRYAYLARSSGRSLEHSVAMVVIVDGLILDGNQLDYLNPKDVYSIEVLRSGAYLAIYGSNAPGGALVITTKRGGSSQINEHPSGLVNFAFKGYSPMRVFYTPKYNVPGSTAAPANSLRTTIYWKPDLLTDGNGKASFQYFNNDTKGTYRVVVEGIDDNGNLGRQVYRYKVE